MKITAGSILCIAFLTAINSAAQVNKPIELNTAGLNGNHDLQLPAWGPYSKHYAGISHIPDVTSGMRFDFSVLPGYYRNKQLIPNVRFESSYFPWKTKSDLSSFTYRYELEWKDQVYTDVTYTLIDTSSLLISMRCVNNTDLPQNLSLNLVASVEYPENYGMQQLKYGTGTKWYNAVDYRSLSFAVKKPTDDLVHDGWMRGEIRDSRFINGRAIGEGFGRQPGDKIEYDIPVPSVRKARLLFIYALKNGKESAVQLSGLVNQKIIFRPSDSLAVLDIPFETSSSTSRYLTLTSLGGGDILLNGIVVTTALSGKPFTIIPSPQLKTPVTEEDLPARTLLLKYQDIPLYYGITWDTEPFKIREIKNDELDIFLRNETHNHVSKVLNGNMKGDYANIFIRPVQLAPHASQTCTALLSCGTRDGAIAILKKGTPLKNHFAAQLEDTIPEEEGILEEGKKYLFSHNLLKSTLLSNVVYPIYTQNQYIRHFTPGKWWNSLYTWDLGFTALGLSTVNTSAAIECVNAYVTSPGSQSAFIHHGSPLPVQIYVFLELWNKTQSVKLLRYFYPRLKQYYEFLAGHYGSSTTDVLSSHLLKTWDYFYNSGGWDDYPPQIAVRDQRLEKRVTPVVTTAHVIRVAKIMRMAAMALDSLSNLKEYDGDIRRFTAALQNNSWDAESGYYSYVMHDSSGHPTGFYKDPVSGVNFNMGLDGAYPLIAGICNGSQQEILTEKIFSDKHMWSPSGITVVDQSAPYYRIDGYWNGAVWMPHQWFVWKTMLDMDRCDLAYKIASKGLDVYKTETDASYYTFEHFLAASGRGAGWHQFSGLSTPVLSWFEAYYKTGAITPGFEIWINRQSFSKDHTSYEADISFDEATRPHKRAMLAGMNPGFDYQAQFNGQPVTIKRLQKGVLQLSLPATNKSGKLVISPVNPSK
ncbi:MGH1-like glycoside hydrolase domain-containing protein [Chitinophaga polysaccharea]|uniref:MGH1-like glycoside hydrolase domain-containing protein n=1 Tax=Chitinophaga polysaccharea TaxID=1293035 RepID=UPI00163C9849|nr:glycoside hydrolase [Chitinophaga polysaccharea]